MTMQLVPILLSTILMVSGMHDGSLFVRRVSVRKDQEGRRGGGGGGRKKKLNSSPTSKFFGHLYGGRLRKYSASAARKSLGGSWRAEMDSKGIDVDQIEVHLQATDASTGGLTELRFKTPSKTPIWKFLRRLRHELMTHASPRPSSARARKSSRSSSSRRKKSPNISSTARIIDGQLGTLRLQQLVLGDGAPLEIPTLLFEEPIAQWFRGKQSFAILGLIYSSEKIMSRSASASGASQLLMGEERASQKHRVRDILCGSVQHPYGGAQPFDSMKELHHALASGESLLWPASTKYGGAPNLSLLHCAIQAGNLSAVRDLSRLMTAGEWSAHEKDAPQHTLLFALRLFVQAKNRSSEGAEEQQQEVSTREKEPRGHEEIFAPSRSKYDDDARPPPQYEEIVSFLSQHPSSLLTYARALDALLKTPASPKNFLVPGKLSEKWPTYNTYNPLDALPLEEPWPAGQREITDGAQQADGLLKLLPWKPSQSSEQSLEHSQSSQPSIEIDPELEENKQILREILTRGLEPPETRLIVADRTSDRVEDDENLVHKIFDPEQYTELSYAQRSAYARVVVDVYLDREAQRGGRYGNSEAREDELRRQLFFLYCLS
ncbi:unnamed protein product [Amoebophrya sp. A120]|nr:unnamed protein product [Amoebophrya sp. A120]|eukprot:GSA120T00002013001.1